jgi:hypothetical protein
MAEKIIKRAGEYKKIVEVAEVNVKLMDNYEHMTRGEIVAYKFGFHSGVRQYKKCTTKSLITKGYNDTDVWVKDCAKDSAFFPTLGEREAFRQGFIDGHIWVENGKYSVG